MKTPARPAVGLRQIAEELNVSVSLVSKVLSGRLGTSGVNEKKIRAIHAKASELNYRKNLLAEALRTGRQKVFACFVHRHGTPGSGIVDNMVSGITEQCLQHQQRLMIHFYESAEEFRSFLPQVHRNAVDGLIIGGLAHFELVDDLKAIHRDGVPIVTIHDFQLDEPFPNVSVNQMEVARRATYHLIDQGCERIAHIRVRDGATPLPRNRSEGYLQALRERGLEPVPQLMRTVDSFTHDYGEQAMQSLLDAGVAFDGVVAQSDQLGVGALNVLVRAGCKVPRDVKVIGIDDAPFCDFSIVPLSSVSQAFRQRGRVAVDLLFEQMEGKTVASRELEPAVNIRASSVDPG
jgi:DNA-binding LacI/PurR family transcriptional regulator